MKRFLLVSIIGLMPLLSHAQTTDLIYPGRYGLSLISNYNGELDTYQFTTGLSYAIKKSQFELGFGFNPFDQEDQKLLSGEVTHKFFPNGTGNKFNLFLLSQLSLVQLKRNTYYPTDYLYLFLKGGYGLQISAFENAYIGTNFNIGVFTNSKRSENPYVGFDTTDLFDEVGFSLEFQVHIGYLF